MTQEAKVAVLVDCDNANPAVVAYAMRIVPKLGRAVIKRGYGNHATLANRWQETLVQQAFTPCLQFQYAAGKNTSDMALALDAMEALFDKRADCFCVVTSDSDFVYLCRKLRERGATVHIVGEAKTPQALRNASDQFHEWTPEGEIPRTVAGADASAETGRKTAVSSTQGKRRPKAVVDAVALMASDSPEGKVHLSSLGQYLRRIDPGFSPDVYGFSGLLEMLRSYDWLVLSKEEGGHYTVKLAPLSSPLQQ